MAVRLPPPTTRTAALAEAGLMASLSVILYLCTYTPVFYIIGAFLSPMPAALITVRHGVKFGLGAAATATAALMAFLGPLDSLLFLTLFGVLGVATGGVIRADLPPGRGFLAGASAVFAADLVGYYGIEKAMGLTDSVETARETFVSWVTGAFSWLQSVSPGPVPLRLDLSAIDDLFTFPLALFLGLAYLAFIANYVMTALVFERLGLSVTLPSSLVMFRPPLWLAVLFLALVPGAAAIRPLLPGPLRTVLVNVALLTAAALALAAFSFLAFALNTSPLRPLARMGVMLTCLVFFPLWPLVGAADAAFDLRALWVRVVG